MKRDWIGGVRVGVALGITGQLTMGAVFRAEWWDVLFGAPLFLAALVWYAVLAAGDSQ